VSPRCFGVLGDPISHSRSPVMHTAAFAELGGEAGGFSYLPFHVSAGELGAALRGAAALGFGGLNLTLPHKRAALEYCDWLSPAARRIGAVNTLRFVPGAEPGAPTAIHGHNTDGQGFLDGLDELVGGVVGRSGALDLREATVLGTGGASLAVVDALLERYPELSLRWVSRRPEAPPAQASDPRVRARLRVCGWPDLLATGAGRGGAGDGAGDGDCGGPARGQLLVNTTIVGLAGGPDRFPIALDLSALDPGAGVVDIVYPRPAGGLLDRAAARGLAVQDGLPMLLHQGARALEIWLQATLAPRTIEAMRAALYGL